MGGHEKKQKTHTTSYCATLPLIHYRVSSCKSSTAQRLKHGSTAASAAQDFCKVVRKDLIQNTSSLEESAAPSDTAASER